MCRIIKPLFNFEPPATDEEIREASLQFVRKISGFAHPSKANQVAVHEVADGVATVARELLGSLVTDAPPRKGVVEATRSRARAVVQDA